jgi:hypothetical protein
MRVNIIVFNKALQNAEDANICIFTKFETRNNSAYSVYAEYIMS